jgi:hypothetical protein
MSERESPVRRLLLDGEGDQRRRERGRVPLAAVAPSAPNFEHYIRRCPPQSRADVRRVEHPDPVRVQLERGLQCRWQRDAQQPRRVSRHAEDLAKQRVVRSESAAQPPWAC